jgi:WXG100 family type VII secretion target
MAEFDVTLSAMTDAASNIKNYTEQFREEADATFQAAQALSEEWQGDASATFVNNMNELHNWMNTMATVLDTYSASLNQAVSTYNEADVAGARNFGG